MARTTPVNTGYTIINGTATGSNGYRVDVWLEYKVLSQSILNNTSELHLLLYAAATYSSTTKWETPGNYGYVGYDGGNQQYLSTAYDFSGYQVNKFGDYTYTIAHNSNGQKSIIAQGAFTTLSSYISGGSASGTVVLPTIARATTLTAQSATLGTEKTFTLSPADASFKHSMTFTFGSASGSITGVTASTSIAYTFSIDLAAQVPNATSGAGTLTISTYASNGTTLIGTSTATITLSVPASVVPTGTVDIEEGVTGLAAQFGAYIRSKSKLSVSIDASGAYGSTIVGYATTIESTVYNGATFTSGFLAQSGAKTAVTVITDSRGRTATINTNYTVVAYENPVIEAFTAVRCDSVGTPDDEGAYVLVSLKGSVSAANNGNTASYQVLYKKTTDAGYTTYTFSGTGYTLDSNTIIASISPDYTWDFVAKITDYFTNTQRPLTVSTAATIMDFKGNGLGISIGKVAENDGLEVDWPATFNDDVSFGGGITGDGFLNKTYPVGAIYISVSSTSPATLFGGTWSAFGAGRVLVGIDPSDTAFDTVEETGGAKTHTLTTAQIPSHSHEMSGFKYSSGGSGARLSYTPDGKDPFSETTGTAGSGGAHNNLQPYVVCYMWKRTA